YPDSKRTMARFRLGFAKLLLPAALPGAVAARADALAALPWAAAATPQLTLAAPQRGVRRLTAAPTSGRRKERRGLDRAAGRWHGEPARRWRRRRRPSRRRSLRTRLFNPRRQRRSEREVDGAFRGRGRKYRDGLRAGKTAVRRSHRDQRGR